MASLKEIAREYRDEIMDGIAWVAIWKTGRSWNAKAFWLNLETERIEDEEMEEAREIVAADPKAIFINEYYTAHMGEGKLDEIVEGMMDKEDHTTEDYGWLEPDGTFYGVEWGEHQEWAQNYMNEKFPKEAMNGDIDLQTKCNVGLIGAGDWLVERGWVLLHNPSRGIAFPTKNPVKEYTKAQKEFLYDYYMERDCKKEANAIWQEDE